MEREWLTVDEIRKEMKVAAMTVYRLINAGKLEAVKVGRSYRINRTVFEAYLERGKTSGDPRS